jgi:Fe-S-cluster-containing dehydrogenase component
MACPYGAIYIDPETNTADKCTYCAHRIAGGMMPSCVVACPVEANIFGDISDASSNISTYIMENQGNVQVRKPEKGTNPHHYYVGGGEVQLNPLASIREEGYSLFNNITHLKHIGKGH